MGVSQNEYRRAKEIERLLAYAKASKTAETSGTPMVASGDSSGSGDNAAAMIAATKDVSDSLAEGMKSGKVNTEVADNAPDVEQSDTTLPEGMENSDTYNLRQVFPQLSMPSMGVTPTPSPEAGPVAGQTKANPYVAGAQTVANAALPAWMIYQMANGGAPAVAAPKVISASRIPETSTSSGAPVASTSASSAASAGGAITAEGTVAAGTDAAAAGAGYGGGGATAVGSGAVEGTVIMSDGAVVSSSSGAYAVGTAEGGGVMMSDGTVIGGTQSGLSGLQAGALGAIGAVGMTDTVMNRGGLINNYDKPRTIKNVGRGFVQGAASGAALGASVSGPAAPVGAVVGGILGGVTGLAGSLVHKGNRAHIARSESRKVLGDTGVVEKSEKGPYHIVNSDGSKFPLLDGKDVPAGKEGAGYNIDRSNPLSGQAAGYGDALSVLFLQGNNSDGIQNSWAAYYGNAFMMAASDQESLRHEALFQFEKLGISFDDAREMVSELYEAGKISVDQKNAYINTFNVMESGKGYTEGSVLDMEKTQPKPDETKK